MFTRIQHSWLTLNWLSLVFTKTLQVKAVKDLMQQWLFKGGKVVVMLNIVYLSGLTIMGAWVGWGGLETFFCVKAT